MLYSPTPVECLQAGADYMGETLSEPLGSLVKKQRVALLGTGSPQLYYSVQLWSGALDGAATSTAASTVIFGLQIEGGFLCVADGYAPMDWGSDDYATCSISLTDGYYKLTALWLPDVAADAANNIDMRIHLHAERAEQSVPGDGWPYLEFRV